MSMATIRREYAGAPLDIADCDRDPFRQFAAWFEQVRGLEADPTAMVLATTSAAGRPSARMVLLKGLDARGFVFFTNYESRKAADLGATGYASLLFYWPSLERQVRVEGGVAPVSEADSDAYFMSRPVESRWGVYGPRQSRPVADRGVIETLVAEARTRYGDDVPRPPWWGGYRVAPDLFEFWQGRPSRLHDRILYRPAERSTSHTGEDTAWTLERLAP
jgi:pyridoxamine 5'-phosphate oxidase